MNFESFLLLILMIVIIIELFLMFLMHIRMKQLTGEVDRLSSRLEVTDVELDQLTKNIEEFKKIKI